VKYDSGPTKFANDATTQSGFLPRISASSTAPGSLHSFFDILGSSVKDTIRRNFITGGEIRRRLRGGCA
jgi:hypothetical protein